jgi:hypothetical protein
VDVVPAFYRQGGGYLIPNTIEKRWIPTNSKVHETFMSNANAAHGSDLVPIVKMIKGWNRESDAKVLRGVTTAVADTCSIKGERP